MFKKKQRTKVPEKVKKARSNKYKFSTKTHPAEGVLSFVLGMISLGILVAVCALSGRERGGSGIIVGVFGMLALLLAIAGLLMAFHALRKKDIHFRFPVAGGIVNGALTIAYLIIYVRGTLL